MTDAIKRYNVNQPYPGDIYESPTGDYVEFDDHSAAVARLEARLSLAEKVVEAAEHHFNNETETSRRIMYNAITAYRSAK